MLSKKPFPTRYKKIIQAAAILLKQSPGMRASYFRIAKLLYLADRGTINEIGRPITGDRAVAFKHGPSLSTTLDLAKDEDPHSKDWSRYIHRDRYELELKRDPGNSELSRFEIETLQGVSSEHQDRDDWQLADWTHTLPEWKKNEPIAPTKRCWISFADILEALGKSDWQERIEQDAHEQARIAQVFGG